MGSEMCIRDRCWVCLAHKDIIIDDQLYMDPFTGIHFSGVVSEDHELFTKPVWSDLKDKYVINTDLFAIKSGIEDTDRSFFLNHVAAKYNWPNPVETVDDIAKTAILTKEQAEQVMREIQILFKVSAIETTSLSMGSVSVFKDLKSVTRSQTHPTCLLYTSPSPRDGLLSRMPSSA